MYNYTFCSPLYSAGITCTTIHSAHHCILQVLHVQLYILLTIVFCRYYMYNYTFCSPLYSAGITCTTIHSARHIVFCRYYMYYYTVCLPLYIVELASRSSNEPRDGPGFDSQWVRCINQASRPSQGTVNGGAFSK